MRPRRQLKQLEGELPRALGALAARFPFYEQFFLICIFLLNSFFLSSPVSVFFRALWVWRPYPVLCQLFNFFLSAKYLALLVWLFPTHFIAILCYLVFLQIQPDGPILLTHLFEICQTFLLASFLLFAPLFPIFPLHPIAFRSLHIFLFSFSWQCFVLLPILMTYFSSSMFQGYGGF